jgi:hypothetical protein
LGTFQEMLPRRTPLLHKEAHESVSCIAVVPVQPQGRNGMSAAAHDLGQNARQAGDVQNTHRKGGKNMKGKNTDKKIIPPLETGGMGFNEVLKRISKADPKEVRKMEGKAKKDKSK